jgi:hypothetical protein
MFPWLFPHGYGGLGNERVRIPVSDAVRKRNWLMYHDKRFQTDQFSSFIAFNHQQIKNSSNGEYLLAKKKNFTDIVNRPMTIHDSTLKDLIARTQAGPVTPETEEEKNCFRLLKDIDYVAAHVDGSVTNRRRM